LNQSLWYAVSHKAVKIPSLLIIAVAVHFTIPYLPITINNLVEWQLTFWVYNYFLKFDIDCTQKEITTNCTITFWKNCISPTCKKIICYNTFGVLGDSFCCFFVCIYVTSNNKNLVQVFVFNINNFQEQIIGEFRVNFVKVIVSLIIQCWWYAKLIQLANSWMVQIRTNRKRKLRDRTGNEAVSKAAAVMQMCCIAESWCNNFI
jgi:hypothetical protein